MCTRFVYNGKNTIVGFNFDIDLAVWQHTIIKEEDKFYIGIKMPDGNYHSFHGVNKNGNVGTLLYVHGNEKGQYIDGEMCYTIAKLTEEFVKGELSLEEALHIVQNNKIVYEHDTTMQAMLSNKEGRVLIIEPGVGYRLEHSKYSLMTNYSVLNPEITKPYIISGDDRYERALKKLAKCENHFSPYEAFDVLKSVKQEGLWGTRVSFVYSVIENKVYYALNNDFEHILQYQFEK